VLVLVLVLEALEMVCLQQDWVLVLGLGLGID
jgi:hypothetical protein